MDSKNYKSNNGLMASALHLRHECRSFSRGMDKDLSEIQKMRRDLGMSPIVVITRLCLKCDAEFETFRHSDNFLCGKCSFSIKGDNVIF